MANWWYALESKRCGPVSTEELKKLILSNSIGAQTLIWTKGMNGWRKLDEIAALKALIATAPPPLPKEEPDADKASSTAKEPPYISTFATEDQQKNTAHIGTVSSRSPDQTAISQEKVNSDQATYSLAKAWPRFFARIFDFWWEGLLVAIIIVIVAYAFNLQAFTAWITGSGSDIMFGLLCIFVALGVDAAVYGIFGNTPGKALLGLRVKTVKGNHLTSGEYISRNLRVWTTGIFFGLPLLWLITMAWQSGRLSKGKQATYDESLRCRVHAQPRGWVPKTVFVLMFIALFAYFGYSYSSRPYQPNYTESNYASMRHGQQLQGQYLSPKRELIGGLRSAAQEINSKAPIMVGDYTRLDGAKAGPGAQITYFYSLINMPSYKIDSERLKTAILPNLEKKVCSTMRTGLRLGATYIYDYRGSDGVEITHVTITQSSC